MIEKLMIKYESFFLDEVNLTTVQKYVFGVLGLAVFFIMLYALNK